MTDTATTIGRFLWKLLFVVVVTFAAMALVGALVRLLFGVEVDDVIA